MNPNRLTPAPDGARKRTSDPRMRSAPAIAPRSSAGMFLQWTIAVGIGLAVFVAVWSGASMPDPPPPRPPPEPRLHELVPSDYMTPASASIPAPGEPAAAGDAALLAGDAAAALQSYRRAVERDSNDRYGAFMAACAALELDDLETATAMLRAATAADDPLRDPLPSIRIAARWLEAGRERGSEPLAERWLRAVAREAAASGSALARAPDPLRQFIDARVLADELAPADLSRLDEEGRAAFAVARGELPAAALRELIPRATPALAHFAMVKLAQAGTPDDAELLVRMLAERAAQEPDDFAWAFLHGARLTPQAFRPTVAPDGSIPALEGEDSPWSAATCWPALPPEAIAALADAAGRTRCDSQVAPLLRLEESVRRAAGDPFAALRLPSARSLLFLGDPSLPVWLRARAAAFDPARPEETEVLLATAIALERFAPALAHDPTAVESIWAHRDQARLLVEVARQHGLEADALERRLAEFEPLVVADARIAAALPWVERPLPVPRLVADLFERYAADRGALVARLRRLIEEG